MNQRVATAFLERFGLIVHLAVDGLEAIERVEMQHFDLVLMDVQMPRMDGLTATRELRKSGFAKLPIIAMTAHATSEARAESLAAGMDEHISKPIDSRELYRTLVGALASESVQSAEQAEAAVAEAIAEVNHLDFEVAQLSKQLAPEIDPVIGMKRSCANLDEYIEEVLEDYRDRFHETVDKIGEAVAAEDWQLGADLAHNVKSVSAMLGAQSLSDAFAAVEQSLRNEQLDDLDAQLQTLRYRDSAVHARIQAYFEQDAEGADSPHGSLHGAEGSTETIEEGGGDSLELKLEQLEEELSAGKAKAAALTLNELKPSLKGAKLSALYLELGELIEEQDFDEAQRTLRKIMLRLG